MKYSIITQKCGCHLLVEALLRSVHKYLVPDEIIVEDTKFKYYSKSERHGRLMHREILKARNDYVLLVDHDIMIFDNSLIEQMCEEISKPNVYACGVYDKFYNQAIKGPLLTEMCTILNKRMYLENGLEFDGSGNPCYLALERAVQKGQLLIKIDGGNRIFHLEAGSIRPYPELFINNIWRSKFENWKKLNNSNVNFDEYVVDDGMDIDDLHQLSSIVLAQVNRKIEYKEPFSLIRLGNSGLKYLEDYLFNKTDPNDGIGKKLIKELIESMKDADWIDHPYTYKGVFNDLCDWRLLSERCSEIYSKAGITTHNTNYCSSLQGYLSFVKDFDKQLYSIMEGRRILFVALYDALSLLNERKDLKIAKYKYYQLSPSADYQERYNVMEIFFKDFKPDEWDLVIVSGGLFGRIMIGRIKKLGGRGFDLGKAISFSPDNIFSEVVIPIENETYYKLNEETRRG